jgi:polyisoprenoid-binding protein YceI
VQVTSFSRPLTDFSEANMTQNTWNIDSAHSSIQFSARHMVITKVRGAFKSYRGTIELDEADKTRSRVSVEIDVASIDTAEAKRDGHLKSSDFLDVAQFPTLRFESRSIVAHGDSYSVAGDLTLHGVTRPVTLSAEFQGQAKDPWGGERVAFTAKTSIQREDFGLTWNQLLEAGGMLVGSKIEIELDVQAVRAVATSNPSAAATAAE